MKFPGIKRLTVTALAAATLGTGGAVAAQTATPEPASATTIDFGASCYTQHEIRTYNWYGPDETLQACESAERPVSQVRVPAGYKFYFRGTLRMVNNTTRAKRYTLPVYALWGTGRLARI